jgi:hypothetical protein
MLHAVADINNWSVLDLASEMESNSQKTFSEIRCKTYKPTRKSSL